MYIPLKEDGNWLKKMESLQDWCFTAGFRHYTGRLSRGATGHVPFMARSCCCWAYLSSSRSSAACMGCGYMFATIVVRVFHEMIWVPHGSTFSYEVKWQILPQDDYCTFQGPQMLPKFRSENIDWHRWCMHGVFLSRTFNKNPKNNRRYTK